MELRDGLLPCGRCCIFSSSPSMLRVYSSERSRNLRSLIASASASSDRPCERNVVTFTEKLSSSDRHHKKFTVDTFSHFVNLHLELFNKSHSSTDITEKYLIFHSVLRYEALILKSKSHLKITKPTSSSRLSFSARRRSCLSVSIFCIAVSSSSSLSRTCRDSFCFWFLSSVNLSKRNAREIRS